MAKDLYSTLGVPKTASDKEVRSAYRKLARKHHPDVNPGDKAAEAKFKDITSAYEVLSDAEKRLIARTYFRGLTAREISEADGVPLGTVKTRLRSALIKVRKANDAKDLR